MGKLNCLLVGAQVRAVKLKEDVKDFFASERGVSNIVAMIIILLIVVLLIGVFWDKLQEWLSGLMDQIFNSSFNTDGLE